MLLFFRLPFILLEMVLRQGVRGLATLVQLLRGGPTGEQTAPPPSWPTTGPSAGPGAGQGITLVEEEEREETLTVEEVVEERPAAPGPSAAEAIRRRQAREADAQAAPPVTPPEPAAPLRGLEDEGHVDREPALVESFGPSEEVHGSITVDEPWDGYDGMAATAVVSRLRGSDEATKAVVRLYEQTHKRRQTILRATG